MAWPLFTLPVSAPSGPSSFSQYLGPVSSSFLGILHPMNTQSNITHGTCRVSSKEAVIMKAMVHVGWMMWRGYLWTGWTVFRDHWSVRILSISSTIWYRSLMRNPNTALCHHRPLPSLTFMTVQQTLNFVPTSQ